MAISAKFEANFDSFNTAVAKAQVKLTDFQGNAGKVEASLNRMADSFSGVKIIQQAEIMTAAIEKTGGASKLTASEMSRVNATVTEAIAKYTALGQKAPQSMLDLASATKKTSEATSTFSSGLGQVNQVLATFGVGLSIGAVVGFGKSLLNMGDEIVRVADRTGLTTNEVQRLSYVAEQSGNSIDELTGAIGQMQNRLSSGDKGAVASVKELGINLAALSAASPATQLQMIATEIAKIPDPADRTRIAMDLFGKSGTAILPTLTAQFADLAKQAPIMSEATVRALDTAGDQLSRFGLQIKVWAAESYNLARRGFDALIQGAFRAAGSLLDMTASMVTMAQKIPGASKVLGVLGVDIKDLTERAQWFRDAAKGMAQPLEAAEVASKALSPAMRAVGEQTTKTAVAVTKVKEEIEKLLPSQNTWALGIGQLNQRIPDLTQHALVAAAAIRELEGWVAPLADKNLPALNKQLALLPNVMAGGTAAIQAATQAAASLGQQIQGGLSAALANVPTLLTQAFTGGGDLIGAVKAIGVQLANAIMTPLMDGLSKYSKAAVTAGTAAAAGLGGAVGGGTVATVAGIASGLGGAAVAASKWGVAMGTAGIAGSVALGAATLGIGAAAIGIATLIKRWKDHNKEVQANTESMNKFVDSVFATATATQVAEAGNKRWALTTITVRDAYLATGRSAADAERDVAAMWASVEKGGAAAKAAIDLVNQAFVEQKQDAEDLDKAIQKYGFSIEELGPTMQRQKLSEQAAQLMNDFRLLAGAGINVDTVLGKMGGSINDFIKIALRTGTEVPASMQPMLQKMVELGTLTDANGNRIEDLGSSGLTFSETMTQGFDRVVKKFDELLAKIGLIPAAVGKIPRSVDVNVYGKYHPPTIENEVASGVSYAARGGMVTSTRVVPFIPRGSDKVPAMLAPGEMVLTPGQQAGMANASKGVASDKAIQELTNEVRGLRADQKNNTRDMARIAAVTAASAVQLRKKAS